MKTIEIKTTEGSVIFTHTCENNTIRKTVEEAVRRSINLRNADLRNADLRNADLSYADLSYANLRNADLRNADLSYANLRNADLRNANLRNANLREANLREADLRDADLRDAMYSILSIFKIQMGVVSDELTLELMRHDAEFVGEEKMNAWADGGDCPYKNMERDFLFAESDSIWIPGSPKLRGKELWKAICKELNIKISL